MALWQLIIAVEVLGILISGIGWLVLFRKSRREKKVNSLIKKKVRESELDQKLINPIAAGNNERAKNSADTAYEVRYHEEKEATEEESVTVQLKIESPRVTRKYMVRIKDRISIGSKKGNVIEIGDTDTSDVHCFLIHKQHRLYVRNATAVHIQILRKKKLYDVGPNPPELFAGDKIILGNSFIEVLDIK